MRKDDRMLNTTDKDPLGKVEPWGTLDVQARVSPCPHATPGQRDCERHAEVSSIRIVTDATGRTALDDAADAYSEVAAGAVALEDIKVGLAAALRTLAANASKQPLRDAGDAP